VSGHYRSRLIDLEVFVHHSTDRAWLISLDGDRNKATWIPKSVCEIDTDQGQATMTVSESIAVDKGLV
jgi:hypothetical protein